MARVFLDYNWENTSSGTRIYAVYFNDVTKLIEADFVKIYNPLDSDFVDFPATYGWGNKMYDQCYGADRYEVYKKQSYPFGDVVLTLNSSSCMTTLVRSVLYRYNDAGGDLLGSAVADVCDFEGSAYLYYEGFLEIGSTLYTDEALTTLLPYSGSGWFRIGTTGYQINASSEVVDIEASYCEIVAPLPDPDPLADLDYDAYLHLPEATAIRFIKDGAVATPTANNTLFAKMKHPGLISKPFDQVIKKDAPVTIQFGSSYPTNSVKIYNAVTGALVQTIVPSQVLANLNQELEVPGFAVSEGSIVGIQIWFPNYPFPDFAFAGNKVNIQGNQVNGQFNVTSVQEGKGLAKGNRVMISDFTINTPESTAVTVTGKYHAELYDVYEAVISVDTNGRYYAVIECSGGGFDAASATSEPFNVMDQLDEYLELNYTNDEDEYGCYYGNSLEHRLWIQSRLFKTTPGGEKTLNRETSAKLIKLDEYITKSLTWECFHLPPYLITQISIALSHDTTKVNSILVQAPEPPAVEYYSGSVFGTLTVELEEVEFTVRNQEGGSIDSSDSYLTIQNAGDKLLINP